MLRPYPQRALHCHRTYETDIQDHVPEALHFPPRSRAHRGFEIRPQMLAGRGKLCFNRSNRGGNGRGISCRHKAQPGETGHIEHPLGIKRMVSRDWGWRWRHRQSRDGRPTAYASR